MRLTIVGILFASIILAGCASQQPYQCNSNIKETSPTSRFNVNRIEGIAYDKETKLTWKICSEGQIYSYGHCAGAATEWTWGEAVKTFGDMGDSWRLPNSEELKSIVEKRCKSPAINMAVFRNAPPSFFWSASQDDKNPAKARYVSFFDGNSYFARKSAEYNIRLVRGEDPKVFEERRELASELISQSRLEELLIKEREAERNAIVRCGSKVSCDKIFSLTKTYITSIANKEIKVVSDNIIETYDPVEVGSIGMVARIMPGQDTSSEIRLSVSCTMFGSEILLKNLRSETEASEALRSKMMQTKIACLSKKISTYKSYHSFINEMNVE